MNRQYIGRDIISQFEWSELDLGKVVCNLDLGEQRFETPRYN